MTLTIVIAKLARRDKDESIGGRSKTNPIFQTPLRMCDYEDSMCSRLRETKTTAWKEAKPLCEKIIEALNSDPISDYFKRAPSIEHPYYSEIMEDYIDLNIIQRKLRDGQYMGMFVFKQDVRNIWMKAYQFMRDDKKVLEAASILRQKFKEMARELDAIPIKRFKPSGDPTPAFRSMMSVLQKYRNELRAKLDIDKNHATSSKMNECEEQKPMKEKP